MPALKMSDGEARQTVDLRNYVEKHGATVGLKIPPKGYIEVKAVRDDDGQVYPFHLLSACLGPEAVKEERAVLTFTDAEAEEMEEVVCASLSVGGTENVAVDLVLDGDFVLGNVNAENTWIHVLGRFVTPEQHPEEDDESDEEWMEEEDESMSDDEDDFDFDEDEYEEEDEDDEPLYKPKSKVKIEQLPDSEEGKDENKVDARINTNKEAAVKKEEPAKKRAKLDDESGGEKKEKKKEVQPQTGEKSAIKKDAPKKLTEGEKKIEAAKAVKKDIPASKEPKESQKTPAKREGMKESTTPSKSETKATEIKATDKPAKSDSKTPIKATTDVKKTEKTPVTKTPAAKQHDASKLVTDSNVAAGKVLSFIKEELKKAKEIKGTDMGSAIAKKFGTPFKKMGFEEKTLAKFVEVHARNEITMENDIFKLK